MAEYISREALLKILRGDAVAKYPFSFCTGLFAAADEASKLPAADVVAVVRCKDCRYWQDNNGGYPHDECRWGKGETPDADDFCSYGERREEDGR